MIKSKLVKFLTICFMNSFVGYAHCSIKDVSGDIQNEEGKDTGQFVKNDGYLSKMTSTLQSCMPKIISQTLNEFFTGQISKDGRLAGLSESDRRKFFEDFMKGINKRIGSGHIKWNCLFRECSTERFFEEDAINIYNDILNEILNKILKTQDATQPQPSNLLPVVNSEIILQKIVLQKKPRTEKFIDGSLSRRIHSDMRFNLLSREQKQKIVADTNKIINLKLHNFFCHKFLFCWDRTYILSEISKKISDFFAPESNNLWKQLGNMPLVSSSVEKS